MENCSKPHCKMGDSSICSQHMTKGSLHEETFLGGKNRMRNQPYPTLFVRSLKEALGSAFNSRLRRAASTPGREGTPPQNPEPNKLCNLQSRNLTTVSVGAEKQQVTNQSVDDDWRSRNGCPSRGIGDSQKASVEQLALSQGNLDASLETCIGTEDDFSSSNVLYPRPLGRAGTAHQPRKNRLTNPTILQTSSECSHNNNTVLTFRGSKHSPDTLDPLSSKMNVEINSTPRMNSYSNSRSSLANDSEIIDSSRNKNNHELHSSSRASPQSKITVLSQSRRDNNNNFGDCLLMEERCSTAAVYSSRSNNYELNKASPKENKCSDPKRRAGVNINTTFDLKLSGLDGSILPHESFNAVRKNDCTANWSVNDVLQNDAVAYSALMDSMRSGPLVHPSFEFVGYNNNVRYPVNSANRHNSTLFPLSKEVWHCDVAHNRTLRRSECSDTASGTLTKAYGQKNSEVHPKSILRKATHSENWPSLNPTLYDSMESSRASADSQFIRIKTQEPVYGVQNCEKALNLLFLHDSAADEIREMDLFFKSKLPCIKSERHVRIQDNSPAQEHVAAVVYPQPLLRNPRHSNRNYNTGLKL